MGEKGNFPVDSTAARGLPKVGHPTAAKDPAAPFAAKDAAGPMAAKDPAASVAAKDLAGPTAPPAGSPAPPPNLTGLGGFVAGRDARRDDDPPAAGA